MTYFKMASSFQKADNSDIEKRMNSDFSYDIQTIRYTRNIHIEQTQTIISNILDEMSDDNICSLIYRNKMGYSISMVKLLIRHFEAWFETQTKLLP
jgi:hypothetical protein